ncbi:hypothetical protein BLOT_007165 [Blomia tropicalis]|nr:hypothetical protein BLOT_007165 [Blomia tropicalis]
MVIEGNSTKFELVALTIGLLVIALIHHYLSTSDKMDDCDSLEKEEKTIRSIQRMENYSTEQSMSISSENIEEDNDYVYDYECTEPMEQSYSSALSGDNRSRNVSSSSSYMDDYEHEPRSMNIINMCTWEY